MSGCPSSLRCNSWLIQPDSQRDRNTCSACLQRSGLKAPVQVQNGGSACVTHSLCCPVCGRPASPHERAILRANAGQPQATSARHRATDYAVQALSEPCRATPGDAREVTGGQGVAGSNPAVPTGSRLFSKLFSSHHSHQKSHSIVKRPSRGARRSCVQASYQGICQSGRDDKPGSQGVKDRSATFGSAQRPRQLRTGGHHPGAPAHRKPDVHRVAAAAGRG